MLSRLRDRFQDELKEVLEIKEARTVKSAGINSSVYKLTSTHGKDYALKCYKDSERFEGYTRSDREVVFSKAVEPFLDTELSVPNIIFSSREGHFTLFEWIDMKELDITCENLLLVLEFTKKTQGAYKGYIIRAKECRLNLAAHFDLVIESIQYLSKEISARDLGSFGQYAANVLKDSLVDLQKLKTSTSTADLRDGISPILSQSDIGFHNMGKADERIIFYDFEYAGVDDPRKLYADIMLQPRYVDSLDTLQIEEEVRLYISELIGIEQKRERLGRFLSVYRHKWIAIMIKYMTSASYVGAVDSSVEAVEGYRRKSRKVSEYA